MTAPAPDRSSAAGRFRRWLPAAVWAAGLLTATSWPNPHVPDVPEGDKVVHLVMYAGLAWLVARAIPAAVRGLRTYLLLLIAVSVFGAVDEWHQMFIPGRSASVSDWLADTTGAAIGALAVLARRREQTA